MLWNQTLTSISLIRNSLIHHLLAPYPLTLAAFTPTEQHSKAQHSKAKHSKETDVFRFQECSPLQRD
jgi:hypothetical protein